MPLYDARIPRLSYIVEVTDIGELCVAKGRLEKDVKKENVRRKERHYGAFSRSFTPPTSVAPDKIAANLHAWRADHPDAEACRSQAKQSKVNVPKTLKAA